MASASERAENTEAQTKQHRAKQAAIVAGLQTILEPDEQLLAFARGKITGGWRGKFAIGLEAFFVPDVNVGLTERRFILQHIHAVRGTPGDILPHKFPLEEIAAISFGDIETFGGEPEGRLVMRLQDEQHFRVKLAGALNCEDAAAMAEVFRSLTQARRKSGLTPMQSVCPHCGHILDNPAKFCPYCGKPTAPDAPTADFYAETVPSEPDKPLEPAAGTETSAPDLDAAPVKMEAPPPAAFAAPDLSEPEPPAAIAEPAPAEPTAQTAPEPAPEIKAAGAMMQDEAGEDLLPEIPVGPPPDEPTLEMPALDREQEADNREEGKGKREEEENHGEQDNALDASIQSPKSEIQNNSAPSPASNAFWREFARISGVATPEVLAHNAEAAAPKSETPDEKLTQAEAEKPAFPLAEEEN